MSGSPPASDRPQTPKTPPRHSIPLQNLGRSSGASASASDSHNLTLEGAGLHFSGTDDARSRYEQAAPTTSQMAANLPSITTYWDQLHAGHDDFESDLDPLALQFALPPDIQQDRPRQRTVEVASNDPYETPSPYDDDGRNEDTPISEPGESDRVPLTGRAQPISGSLARGGDAPGRDSFQTVSSLDNDAARRRDTNMLGYDLEHGAASDARRNFGSSLAPSDYRRSRSPSSAGPLQRTASIVRAMSQRVVNISGEGDFLEQQARRDRSRSPSVEGRKSQQVSRPMLMDSSYPSQTTQTPMEKSAAVPTVFPEPQQPQFRRPMPNPLRGNTLGIFSPHNRIRLLLCDILVHPVTEPLILCLIVLQTVLLAVEAGPNVYEPGNGRPTDFANSRTDWAIFVLFLIFTVETIIRIIVSGFVFNAPEYSTREASAKKGFRQAIAQQYKTLFQPQRQKSVKAGPNESYGPSTFARSFTMLQGTVMPESVKDQQRLQLARRAFLRHGFNRLDFVAVVSFWISFILAEAGIEHEYHIYLFRMLSCLRILRLLAITRGNLIILRSLKKAAPLLVQVSFLIGFFWLLFAIIGVQSFKESLSRTCVWLDPLQPDNISASYTNNFRFCGGYLSNDTTEPTTLPWVYSPVPGTLLDLQNGATSGKGFICPRGSICLEQRNPYNGTVNFDNIINSIELVFVVMSANTFTDLLYYTTDSDYLAAAFFFVGAIMILMLWMTNLLIAVITSSFQVIREESRSSAFTADKEPMMPMHLSDEPLRRASILKRVYDRISFIWIIAITFDLLVQCFRSSDMQSDRAQFIDVVEIVVTLFLDVEIIIRFAADWRRFHREIRNLVDLGLAVATSVILLPPIHGSGMIYDWLTIFQILRVYRVVLAVPVTRSLIQLVLGNAAGIANLVIFVFLMTFFVSIFASQLFRGQIPEVDAYGNNIEITFATIYNSFLGMYQLLSSENWTLILYNVTAFSTEYKTAWIGAIFLIGWFILAYFILVNMFIAVIQENFDVSEDVKRFEQVKAFLQRKEIGGSSSNLALSTIFSFGRNRKKDPLDYGPAMMEMLLKEAVVQEFLDEAMDPLQQTHTDSPSLSGCPNGSAVKPGILSSIWGRCVSLFGDKDPNPFYSNFRISTPGETFDPRKMAREAVNATTNRRKAQRDYLLRHPTYNNSLFLFTPKNPVRHLCQLLVGPGRGTERFDGVEPNKIAWYTFSTIIYAAIVAIVILACVTTPLYQKEYFTTHVFSVENWFVWIDTAFAVVFTVEAIIKVIADGFFWTPNAYFRSSWGIIDAVVLITLWINVVTLFANDGAVSRAVGAFKALRALRLLNVSESARETFHSLLIVGAWKILSAAFVSLSLIIPFGIYALNLFNGKLLSCNDNNDGIVQLVDCYGEWNSTPYNNNWPLLAPRASQNPYFNFDDFGSSLFTLFQIVSQEGWVDVSFAVQSITGKGLQPVFGIAPGNAALFVVFNLLSTVFVLTLFISVFMRNYTEQTGVAFLTTEQRSWLEMRKLLRQISPSKTAYKESTSKIKKWCHKRAIEKRGKWYIAITCVLVLHLILLMLEFAWEPAAWTYTRDALFLVFTLIYIVNFTIRIIGLGRSRFRRSSWDLYSLAAVTGAFVTSILYLSNDGLNTYVQLHKFFLVAIVLLLIPRNDALDQLFKTAAASLTTIGNLLATWLIFFLVFAIAMTQTFSLTRFGANETNNLNLRNVPKALIMLFRMSCGEGWNQIMEDYAMIEPPLCVEGDTFFDSDCGSGAWARVLFTAWNITSMYIFVNLFVSLIYESFAYVYQRSSGLSAVDRDEIRRFKEAWRSVDPAGTGFISKEAFPRLLGELSGVFEMRIYDAQDSVHSILEDVRGEPADARHASISTQSGFTGIDIKKLNERLNQIDIGRVRERRRRFNIFFEEVLVSADPLKGISFTNVLMTLAHYNIINDSKSLRLEEFLRRRARLQRVEEEVRRRIVLGFFDTLYWARIFKRHMQSKHAGRMTTIPKLDLPDIFVDDGDDHKARSDKARSSTPSRTGGPDGFLGVNDAMTRTPHRSWAAGTLDLPSITTSFLPASSSLHPLGRPRAASSATDGSGQQRPTVFSFEVQEPLSSQPGSAHSSRRGSSVSPAQVREMLDDSVWMESIRRSATTRQSDHWGGFR